MRDDGIEAFWGLETSLTLIDVMMKTLQLHNNNNSTIYRHFNYTYVLH
jgi:hypothetical protein